MGTPVFRDFEVVAFCNHTQDCIAKSLRQLGSRHGFRRHDRDPVCVQIEQVLLEAQGLGFDSNGIGVALSL